MQGLALKITGYGLTAPQTPKTQKVPMTTTNKTAAPLVGVVMGSSSDWETMQHAVQILTQFGVAHEARVVSAHRMPDELFAYAERSEERRVGKECDRVCRSRWSPYH